MISRSAVLSPLALVMAAGLAQPLPAVDLQDTRLMAQPALSAKQVAFLYAGDLWTCAPDGGAARRLTTRGGCFGTPRFSPDGAWIAYSAGLEGNADVWVIPAAGGEPRRLTWHPGPDLVQDWTPDGKAVLFTSGRSVHTQRFTQLFTVPLAGGMPTRLPIPNAARATYSPDGSHIVYNPLSDAFRQWKHYRGGTASRLWIYRAKDHEVTQIPQPEGRCNDIDPMWIGGKIYFVSDRAGEFNLFSYDVATQAVVQLTKHADFPIQAASHGAGQIVYEQAGWLHRFDPPMGRSSRLKVAVAADLPETRSRWASGAKWARNLGLSPSGNRLAVEYRGEILSVPSEKGDARNLTNTPGNHERSPIWSPDGKAIAYLSDAGGEYALKVQPQDGKGEIRTFSLKGAGFYANLKWSPDGKKIACTDNALALHLLDLATGSVKTVSSEMLYTPSPTLTHSWSPDSRFLVYTRNTESGMQRIHVYALEDDKSTALTDGLADAGEPVFDRSGKYLYFTASTEAGPVRDWFAQSNADALMRGDLYLMVLAKDTPSPLAKESDEEAAPAKSEDKGGKPEDKKNAKAELKVHIDFDGLAERILPIEAAKTAFFADLEAGEAGSLYYRRQSGGINRFNRGEAMALCRFDLKKREETVLVDKADGYSLSADGKKLVYRLKDSATVIPTTGKAEPGKGKVALEGLQVPIEPRKEWAQILDEVWRINRDYFYAPNMHGADWRAMKQKYAAFLPHLATRSDLNRVIQWMCSELAVGHHRGGGGDLPDTGKAIPGGLLGADLAVSNGRYQFTKIFGGLNWNPELRSPLTEPGVNVKVGDYLLAVNGRDLKAPENLHARFENTAGKLVELTVGRDPSGKEPRAVTVVPVGSEAALRNRDWVEGNLQKVHAATEGRVAYVYVPNTTTLGHTYFKRYFYPQAQKDAVIIDERYNGGGQVADYYIDLLRRPFIAMWAMRYGQDLKTPQASIQGPKVMLVDETAGSGGDLLPWMFRKFGLGPLVGRPTWGGLVGILGFPTLMDGGNITAPNLAIWTEKGWVVENEGVAPDIEVEQLPKDIIAGRDPQLEKAIELMKTELKKSPPQKLTRPPYPVRTK
ncbi:MAG: PD40 domain-containing protein [Holophagaceae bacterium]|uniref:Tricorn protease homolog n=1 Tax=Candidatus Geothrix skivensis TaxID=2954439 RepID=A0A9D7SJZ2_9BACT|nr:PD40 domain-containing protein [Candidatus Geothrix skivensis]